MSTLQYCIHQVLQRNRNVVSDKRVTTKGATQADNIFLYWMNQTNESTWSDKCVTGGSYLSGFLPTIYMAVLHFIVTD